MNTLRFPLASLASRALLSSLFLIAGLGKLAAPAATKAYIASVGLPLPDVAYVIAVLTEVGLGTLLLIGYRAQWVAILLALFTLVTAFVFHAHFGDPMQQVHFLKNLSITGGLLQVAIWGAGSFSLDARRVRGVAFN